MLQQARDFAEKFRPKAKASGPVVDFDAIISTEQYVRFMGKTHTIKPIEVQEFFALANAWANIEGLKKEQALSVDQLVDAYYGIIFPVCSTITKEMIRAASMSQIAALIQFVDDHVNGRITDEKKKSLVSIPRP